MGEYSIYIDRDDYHQVEEDEQNSFVRSVLSAIGIPFEDIWPENEPVTVEIKIKLRKLFDEFDLDIITKGRDLEIYVGKDLIATWKKPRYIIRKDPKALQQSQKTYFEVQFSFWSLFEEEGVEEDDIEGD